jgi:transposase InsO family protein
VDEFMSVVGLKSRKHSIRLLSGRKKQREGGRPPGRPRVYSSNLMEEELLSIWRDLDYPSSAHLKASLSWIIPLKELHGHRFDPKVKELMAFASRSTIERILSRRRPYEKGKPPRMRYKHNPLTSEIPLAIDYPRPDEPGHIQVDLVHFSGGDSGGHYICAVVVVDRCTLWVEIEPCMGRSRDAVLGALKEALSRIPWKIKTLQTDNGSEFLNDHLRFFCKARGITFIRSRQGRKNDNAHVEGSIGNIIRKDLGYLRYETHEALEIIREICRGPLRWTYNFLRAATRYHWERIDGRAVRKHDEMRPPFVRATEREDVPEETKHLLLETFLSINPNGLSELRKELMRRLFNCAARPGASRETKPSGGADEPHLVSRSARLAQN